MIAPGRHTVEEVADATTITLAHHAQRTVVAGPADVWRPASNSAPLLHAVLQAAAQPGADPVETA